MTKSTKEQQSQMKAFALYGEYFQAWAMLEDDVLNCIQKAIGLDDLQRIAVFSHTQWRDKIDILRTLVSLMPTSQENRTEYDKRLVKIAALAGTRNMAAHNLFFADTDGSLIFYQKKAKGKVETPVHKWTRKSVDGLIKRLFEEIEFLAMLQTEIPRLKSISDMASLLSAPRPMNAFSALGSGLLSTLPEGNAAEEDRHSTPESDPL